MDEKKLKNIIAKVLAQFHCRKYSFEASGEKNSRVVSILFSLPEDDAAAIHKKLSDEENFYAFGWYMSPLFNREADEFRIDFKKV